MSPCSALAVSLRRSTCGLVRLKKRWDFKQVGGTNMVRRDGIESRSPPIPRLLRRSSLQTKGRESATVRVLTNNERPTCLVTPPSANQSTETCGMSPPTCHERLARPVEPSKAGRLAQSTTSGHSSIPVGLRLPLITTTTSDGHLEAWHGSGSGGTPEASTMSARQPLCRSQQTRQVAGAKARPPGSPRGRWRARGPATEQANARSRSMPSARCPVPLRTSSAFVERSA